MSTMDFSEAKRLLLASCSFVQVDPVEWTKNEKFWIDGSIEVAKLIRERWSPGLRLDTGGGKTIIAIMAAILLGARTLILTPTKYLSTQHFELLLNILGYKFPSRVITGETSPKNRIWTDRTERFVFATADVFYTEMVKGKVSPEVFDLIILDEFDTATGRAAYVLLAPHIIKAGVPHMGLSASPGDTEAKVELILLNAGLDKKLSLQRKMPYRSESYHFLTLPREMERACRLGWQPLKEKILGELREAGMRVHDNWCPSAKQYTAIRAQLKALPDTENVKRMRRAFPKFSIFSYCYYTFVTISYHAFLEKVMGKDRESMQKRFWEADKSLLRERLFHPLILTAKKFYDRHPKVLELERELRNLARVNGKALVFFNDRKTALYCKEYLLARGINTEVIFGGNKSIKKQQAAINLLKSGSVSAILATSVIHRGVSVPEVDLVINYAVASSSVIRLQCAGRTGRVKAGHVVHIIMNNDLDRLLFFIVNKKTKDMIALAKEEAKPLHERHNYQMSLFVS